MSHSTLQNQRQKVNAISGLKSDIIFLSDLRLGNKNLTSSKGDITNLFRVNNNRSYIFETNSTRNKRGVGILIASDLNAVINNTVLDPEENFIMLNVTLGEKVLTLGSIYGPNEHNPAFFQSLFNAITSLGNVPVVIGGDFNCTVSRDPIDQNIDCLFMHDLPNIRHSIYLAEFCEELGLCDPFRLKYPTAKKFSYKPFGAVRKNRSRIDFFLTSNQLMGQNFECSIGESPLSKAFDHKPCFLSFPPNNGTRKGIKKLQISPSILADTDIDIVVWYSIFETYLHHLHVNPDIRVEIEQTLRICGNIRKRLKDAGPDPEYYVAGLTEEVLVSRTGNI
jgi:exonuclease III